MEQVKLVVIGAGPGGYAAAFMAADLGIETVLIDKAPKPGGVCLNRGCIPSKALLHAAKVISESQEAKAIGVEFGEPTVDLDKLRAWKDGILRKLSGGLGMLAKQRKVTYLQGTAKFIDNKTLEVSGEEGKKTLNFEHCIIATGSRPTTLPHIKLESPRIWDSTGALELKAVPKSLLVIGGGYIGLEMATVYAALGAEVSVVEMLPGLLPGADRDLANVLARRVGKQCKQVLLDTKVMGMVEADGGIKVTFEGKLEEKEQVFENVLVSIGRKPNSGGLGLENTAVKIDSKGFIEIDDQARTAEAQIFAIGDVAGEPMLAHKASHEGIVAAEVIAGKDSHFTPKAIPAVVFTDPEVAWCGLTEEGAKALDKTVTVARFPWAASGRAITLNRTDGSTKLIIDPDTEKILGVGIVGPGAGDLISEGVLAVEQGLTANDMRHAIHPHPTLSETVMVAAEVFYGTATDIYRPKASTPKTPAKA
jgi:dihydrolipoamide dehydrogenase